MPDAVACRTIRPMTWGESRRGVETCGLADGMAIDATDDYAPQFGKQPAVSVADGAALMRTRDIGRGDLSRDVCGLSCRTIAGPDPQPGIMRTRRTWRHVRSALGLGLLQQTSAATPRRNNNDRRRASHALAKASWGWS